MESKSDRKWRLEQLLHKQKAKERVEYSGLFNECVEALGEDTIILSESASGKMMDELVHAYPIASWGRIDWSKVSKKYEVALTDVLPTLKDNNINIETPIYLLWSGNHPALQTELSKIINSIEDVLAVDFDTYIFCPEQYVIEFYHDGQIMIGFA